MTRPHTSPLLIAALAVLAMVGPVATDMYMPGFPQMQEDFHTSSGTIQLTITSFMIGMAVGQLFWGPLSDRVGRRRPLLVAATLLVIASAAAAVSWTIWMLILARFVQGFAGSAGVVIGRAVARDVASGKELARLFSMIGVVMGLAPILAPILGGMLDGVIGWKGVLWCIFGISVVMLACAWFVIPESLPQQERTAGGIAPLWQDVRIVFADLPFLGYTASSIFSFGVVFAFISSSSYIYQDGYGLSSMMYTLFFSMNAVGTLIVGLLNTRLVQVFPERSLLFTSLLSISAGSVVILTLSLLWDALPMGVFTVVVLLTTCTNPIVMSTTSTLGLSRHKRAAGMASAVMGTLQFAVAGAVAPLVTLSGQASPLSMSTVMVGSALLALAGALLYIRRPGAAAERG
ncbi:MAG TPA: multidrug effflux MFS transporter [Pseudoclavibacter sp.]|nr:multidrug effflux MFS transporter [Pseudoclavibacter sp.]